MHGYNVCIIQCAYVTYSLRLAPTMSRISLVSTPNSEPRLYVEAANIVYYCSAKLDT